jgi:hypothetical protein
MTDSVLREIIERAIGDENFRIQLFSHPDKALQGYNLTDEDRRLLEGLNADNFDDFAGGLGDRSTK